MFKKILYPTDFSDVSLKAMDYIRRMKDSGTQEVVIMHVIDRREFEHFEQGIAWVGELPADLEERFLLNATREASKKLQIIAAELTNMGFSVEIKLETGIPFNEIIKAEKEEGVSAIAVGSHGKSNVKEMFLGSVSEKVIRKSKKPVLVIKR